MRYVALLALLVISGALSACESTQDKSARLGRSAGGATKEHGVVVKHQSKDVRILSTRALQDANGVAAVVTVRNVSKKPLSQLPVSIDVTGAKRASVFRNDQPGLEPSLVGISVLRPGQQLTWVNDQVTPTGKAKAVRARVGDGKQAGSVPQVKLSAVKLEDDPVSGIAATGFATNKSKVEQRKLVIFAVARKRARVVAAGRGQIKKLKPGKRGRFTVFFIGNPKGAQLELAAPATALQG